VSENATRDHWDDVFRRRPHDQVSWYQATPETSLRLLRQAAPQRGPIVDVGGGASALADALLDDGWTDVTVLDVSEVALRAVRERLGHRPVEVVVADVRSWAPTRHYEAWHDRAVFHFLVDDEDRGRYVDTAARAVAPGGAVVIATFAADGPDRCSGLPTARYDPSALADAFRPWFDLEHADREEHPTPGGVIQPFTWAVLRRAG
jgi:SAM-dependent methyltransferase